MKSYLKKTVLFAGIFCVLISLTFIYRIERTNAISWKLPNDTHILFMGASHIEKGINDSIYKGSVNLAKGSERYLFTYIKLKKILKKNKQIDTVFLEFAPTDVWRNTDSKYYSNNEMSYFLPLYSPLFSKEEWNVYERMDKEEMLTLMLQKSLKGVPSGIHSFGEFSPSSEIFESQLDTYEMPDWSEKGQSINYGYLEKIINLSIEKNVKLYLLYMPMYKPQLFYDQKYYYEVYKEQFAKTELLDYSHWECPDNFRADEHHLNIFGAKMFTKELFDRFHH